MKPEPGSPQPPPSPTRRPLDAAAAAGVRRRFTSPEALRQWEEEQQLSGLLQRLPDRPVPREFTDRVLRALDERPAATAAARWSEGLREWIARPAWTPRLAAVATILLLGSLVWIGRTLTERRQLASSVAAVTRPVQEVAQATRLPPVEVLQDFEAIDQMRRLSSPADEELLASLVTPGS